MKRKIITHITKTYFHFWFIPSIEADWEHFKSERYGEYKWLHIYFAWLFWAVDIEWEK